MKLISWNVNGLRAAIGKGFYDFFASVDADAFCLQETKMQPGQVEVNLPGYYQYWNSADRKGYSGTAVFVRREPLAATYDFGGDEHRHEGRVITLAYPGYYLITVYSPNSQAELARIDYRVRWEEDFAAYIRERMAEKPVIICGDMNVARHPIDLYDPEQYEGSAGYSEQERHQFEKLLALGLTDSYRFQHPDEEKAYTWWSYMRRSRPRNAGWRIDYFLVSASLEADIRETMIYKDVMGSDHCPIGLVISLPE
ncbi:MAG: exodeoxyribonuclease III [Clostridia bacterium]|nr:exodeoxyribonuclease III [Clostridia bacterium]